MAGAEPMKPSLVGLAVLSLAAVSCEDRPGDRALRDSEVGRASAGATSFEVIDGLAAVHRIAAAHDAEPGSLTLWASAPSLTVRAKSGADAPQSWTVTLLNAMVDGNLQAAPPALAVPLDHAPDDPPTTRRFELTLPPGEHDFIYRTADAGARGPFRVALLSDVQEGIDEVGDVFRAIEAQPDLRFVLGAGDLADTGSRAELERFQHEMKGLTLPYYTTLGNHDVHGDEAWHPLFGRGSFRFVFRGVQFTLLDSAAATIDTLTYQWLDGWLDEGRDRVHVVAMHVPPLDPIGTRNGAFGDRHEAGALLASLADAGVDLTLYGHIHSFYQYENAGIPAFISGGGGAGDEKLDNYGRHFMVIEIGADTGVTSTDVVWVDPPP